MTENKRLEGFILWQKAMDLVVDVYKLTLQLPPEERFGLSSQIKRCVVSIPSNIAEGKRRSSAKEFRYFLYVALGSASELETQLEISRRLGFIQNDEYLGVNTSLQEVMKIMNSIVTYLKTNN